MSFLQEFLLVFLQKFYRVFIKGSLQEFVSRYSSANQSNLRDFSGILLLIFRFSSWYSYRNIYYYWLQSLSLVFFSEIFAKNLLVFLAGNSPGFFTKTWDIPEISTGIIRSISQVIPLGNFKKFLYGFFYGDTCIDCFWVWNCAYFL